MAKRVKKDFRRVYVASNHDNIRMTLAGGGDCLSVRISHGDVEVWFALPVWDVETLWATDVLEDVPEPWERVRNALHQAAKEQGSASNSLAYQLSFDVLVRAAELLGIKPEGE